MTKTLIDNLQEQSSLELSEVNIHNQRPGLYPLLVENISSTVKHKMLFNIFSLYGNIDKIFVDTNKLEAIVYYETEFNQLMGLHYLQDVCILGEKIKIQKLTRTTGKKSSRHSDYSNSRKNSDKEIKASDLLSSKQKTINKPNNILYIFNLSKKVTLKIIKGIF